MTAQPSLWDAAPTDTTQRRRSISERFWEYHDANPAVYDLLVRFAREARAAGRQHIGIQMLIERARWHAVVETVDPGSEFKINNNYASHYARLIMAECPDLDGFFEVRELRAA